VFDNPDHRITIKWAQVVVSGHAADQLGQQAVLSALRSRLSSKSAGILKRS
jgi:hypothetical protein